MGELNREGIIGALREAKAPNTAAIPLDEDAAWADIERAINTVRQREAINDSSKSGAARREHYRKLATNLEAARKGLTSTFATPEFIDPFCWAWGQATVNDPDMIDWEHVENELKASLAMLVTLETWTKLAAKEAEGDVVAHRPSRRSILSHLICELAPIYQRYTDRKPARSVRAIDGTGSGPFVRFVQSVANAMNLNVTETGVGDAIKREKRDPESPMTRELLPPAAEIFAHFVMGQK